MKHDINDLLKRLEEESQDDVDSLYWNAADVIREQSSLIDELKQFLDAAIADSSYFEKQRDDLLCAILDCSCALNQFDPYDDIACLWQLKSDVDIDSVLNAARNAIESVKGKP